MQSAVLETHTVVEEEQRHVWLICRGRIIHDVVSKRCRSEAGLDCIYCQLSIIETSVVLYIIQSHHWIEHYI